MPALLQISIGPVQEFIASARRSRDLWFGSWVLSEVAKAAALQVAQAQPRTHVAGQLPLGLIFPAPTSLTALGEDSTLNAPNKIVALIDGSPSHIADLARKAALGRLERIRDKAFGHLPNPDNDAHAIYRDIANLQITDLLEFAWVAVQIDDVAQYGAVRERAEGLLAARKATRLFAPVTWGSNAPKSSLDGQRESVIPKRAFDDLDPDQLYRYYRVRPGEHLCGVGLLKRHGDRGGGQDRFFSTSHVAALPLLSRLRPKEGQVRDEEGEKRRTKAITEYLTHLRDEAGIAEADLGNVPGESNGAFGHRDGHLLFEERLAEYIPDKEKCRVANGKLRAMLGVVFGVQRLSPYYGLLHADGDRMGAAIEAQQDPVQHRQLSQALDRFADKAREIVPRHDGSLVYAGGDDVLAFLPLHTILLCARELADQFKQDLAPFGTANGKDPAPTLSVGIAVVHHLEPLTDALELAREAERIAKARLGKNALAVILSKRSGADRTIVGGWDERVALGALDARLQQFAGLHATGAMPDGLAYELAVLHRRLSTSDDTLAAQLAEPLRFEALRILDRKRDQVGQKLDAATYERLETLLHVATLREDPSRIALTLGQIATEMIVARDLSDAIRQAE